MLSTLRTTTDLALLTAFALVIGATAPRAQCPDLVITELTVLNLSPVSVTYRYEVTNMGNGPASLEGPTGGSPDNVSIQMFISSDTVYANGGDLAAGGRVLGMSPIASLAPGAKMVGIGSGGLSINAATHPFLVAKVDQNSVLVECNETNNTASSAIAYLEMSGAAGCTGSNGVPTLASSFGFVPRSSTVFSVDVTDLSTKPTDAVFMMLSFAQLGAPLDVIGMNGCVLHVNPVLTQALAKTGSTARWQMQFGPSPAAIGRALMTQVFAVDTNPAPNAFGATVSNAMAAIVFM